MSEPAKKKPRVEQRSFEELIQLLKNPQGWVDFSVCLEPVISYIEFETKGGGKLNCPRILFSVDNENHISKFIRDRDGPLVHFKCKTVSMHVMNTLLNIVGCLYIQADSDKFKMNMHAVDLETWMDVQHVAYRYQFNRVSTVAFHQVQRSMDSRVSQETFNVVTQSVAKMENANAFRSMWYQKLSTLYFENSFACPDLPFEFWENVAERATHRPPLRPLFVNGDFLKCMNSHSIGDKQEEWPRDTLFSYEQAERVTYDKSKVVDLRTLFHGPMMDHLPVVLVNLVLGYIFDVLEFKKEFETPHGLYRIRIATKNKIQIYFRGAKSHVLSWSIFNDIKDKEILPARFMALKNDDDKQPFILEVKKSENRVLYYQIPTGVETYATSTFDYDEVDRKGVMVVQHRNEMYISIVPHQPPWSGPFRVSQTIHHLVLMDVSWKNRMIAIAWMEGKEVTVNILFFG